MVLRETANQYPNELLNTDITSCLNLKFRRTVCTTTGWHLALEAEVWEK